MWHFNVYRTDDCDENCNATPLDLSLYICRPRTSGDYAEMLEQAGTRLKVLQVVEAIFKLSTNIQEKRLQFMRELRERNFKTYVTLMESTGSDDADRSKERVEDLLSHYMLRFSHLSTQRHRLWLVNREAELLRLRFRSLDKEGIYKFLHFYRLAGPAVSQEEKMEWREELALSVGCPEEEVAQAQFRKIAVSKAGALVEGGRRFFVRAGYVYMPYQDLDLPLCRAFRHCLMLSLENFCKNDVPKEEEYFRSYPRSRIGIERQANGNKLTPAVKAEDLDRLSDVSYPLCMRQIHKAIRKRHHAPHDGRMQYGLFLKGIGLSLDQAIKFWEDEFTQTMTKDHFRKEYLYLIRHNYGWEGKKVSYSPFSCAKIIKSPVGYGSCSGCPFKHNGLERLSEQLESCGLSEIDIEDVSKLVVKEQYTSACSRVFHSMHSVPPPEIIYHPNQYFELSQRQQGLRTEVYAQQLGSCSQARDQASTAPVASTSKMDPQRHPASPVASTPRLAPWDIPARPTAENMCSPVASTSRLAPWDSPARPTAENMCKVPEVITLDSPPRPPSPVASTSRLAPWDSPARPTAESRCYVPEVITLDSPPRPPSPPVITLSSSSSSPGSPPVTTVRSRADSPTIPNIKKRCIKKYQVPSMKALVPYSASSSSDSDG